MSSCFRKRLFQVQIEKIQCFLYYSSYSSSSSSRSPLPFHAIPSPKKLPIIGHLHLFGRFGPYSFEKLYDAYADLHKKYGSIVSLDLGLPLIALFEPEDVKKLFLAEESLPRRPLFEALRKHRLTDRKLKTAGLFAENGMEWQRLRKATNFMMKPGFSHPYLPSQARVADDFVDRIRSLRAIDGTVKDFLQELYRFTEEAIGLVCFGTRLGLFDDQDVRSKQLTKAADETLEAMADTLLGFPWWKLFKTPTYKRLVNSQNFFHNFSSECLEKARLTVRERNGEAEPNLEFLKVLTENDKLTEYDVALLMTEVFSAGIDATGIAIGFALYNLAKRSDVQEKLFQEICHAVPEGNVITPETLSGLRYLRMCIKESHRLTPAVGGIARILNQPTVLSGYEIPKDVLCIGVNPVICKNKDHFEDPLNFQPERWSETDPNKKAHPYCVLPFSHGTRRCVGQRFAEQEIQLCLLKIVRNFRVEYDGPPIGTKMRLSLTPDQPMDFRFVDR